VSLASDMPGKQTKLVLGNGCPPRRFFAKALRSVPRSEVQSIGLKCRSSHLFDLLPV
jgi:hypothetical protein